MACASPSQSKLTTALGDASMIPLARTSFTLLPGTERRHTLTLPEVSLSSHEESALVDCSTVAYALASSHPWSTPS
eukprot:CAMPEP_0195599804 /NCGR_PEP_ID=MMETSP0815-20121206/4222_1 /TAXON_ID=97485 /ORGANISM="Prymnesium parvum, Strain Texoma1" /LENGTH=75 /DNA_ID=CAMNT_0040739253 /DNA_START=585 /DNA_END=809 /DNA_ORIENTATION=-